MPPVMKLMMLRHSTKVQASIFLVQNENFRSFNRHRYLI